MKAENPSRELSRFLPVTSQNWVGFESLGHFSMQRDVGNIFGIFGPPHGRWGLPTGREGGERTSGWLVTNSDCGKAKGSRGGGIAAEERQEAHILGAWRKRWRALWLKNDLHVKAQA